MAHATDIVGYTYRADVYCPRCIGTVLAANRSEVQPGLPAERLLDSAAAFFGIDRHDESTFDSSEFPKVVFRDMVGANLFGLEDDVDWESDRCASCGEVLGE